MKDAYRIKDGNGKFYRGEENGGGWTGDIKEAKVYESLKDLPAALVSDDEKKCRKKRIRYEGIKGYTGIRYCPEHTGKDAGGEGESKITAVAYSVTNGRVSSIGELPPDDPIYTRGFIIGGTFSRMTLKRNPATVSKEKKSETAE